MLSSFVGWIMLSSSSSSSSSSLYNEDDDIDDDFYDIVSAEPDEEKNDAVVQRDAVVEDGYPIPVAIAVTDASAEVTVAAPGTMAPMCDYPNFATTVVGKRKRRRIENDDDILSTQEDKKYLEENPRRLSHRLWTNEDEIQLLQGFLEYKTRHGSRHHNVNTALFYDEIKSKLQVRVNKNQLFDKLCRFKKKYLDVLDKISSVKKFSFKSAHDEATFEISLKIWGHSIPMSRLGVEDNALVDDHEQSIILDNLNLFDVKVESEEVAGDWRPRKRIKSLFGARSNEKDIPNSVSTSNDKNNEIDDNIDTVDMIEETVRSCLSPLFKELLSNALGPMPSSIGGITSQTNNGEVGDEKWREQRILELEVYSKRLELVRDQMKATLEELRSREG